MDGDEEDKPQPRSASMRKAIHVLLMLFAAVLFISFSYHLFHSSSSGGGDVPSVPAKDRRVQGGTSAETRRASYIQLPGLSKNGEIEYLQQGQCDLFSGKWEYDPSGPAYTNLTCESITSAQNCLRNGRPDKTYLYWRWKPYGCDLPPFDPFKFFDAMKDKSWAFIGDSILRNQIESLICLLSQVEKPVEVYHDKAFKSRTWHFSNHNLTLALIWSRFLVKSQAFDDASDVQLYLDIAEEEWTSQYNKHDYIIFSGGEWFLKTMVLWENDAIVGCHNCNKSDIKELGVDFSYRKALRTAYEFMSSSEHKPLIFFRTWNPDHFEFGEWFSGGICNRTNPYGEGQYRGKPMEHVMRAVELEEFEKAAAAMNARTGARLRLFDNFHLSLLRPDGHPGPYRTFPPFAKDKNVRVQNDCLHWCLPGPIDTWNELIMKILVDEGDI